MNHITNTVYDHCVNFGGSESEQNITFFTFNSIDWSN